MAGFSTGLLGFQQSADDYYKNLANDAMMQGQQAETDRQNAQQYAQLAASLPLYDPTNLDYARQMVAAKVGYEQAADAAEQARHHENAEIVRREAAKNGIDLSRFDAANVNANQANTNLSMMINEARRDFMNRETPDELYARRKNELMRDGLNEERAMDQAAREYQEYSARYRHAGRNLFYDQGTTENAINNLGAYVLTGLGDPQTAQMFASMYAHPVDNYNLDAWTQKALTTADLANQQAILRNNLGIQAANNNFNNQRILSNEQFAQALQKFAVQNQYARENAEAGMQAQLQYIQDLAGLYKQYIPNATDADAFAFAVSGIGGGSRSGANGKQSARLDGKIEDALGRYEEQESKVENLLRMGNRANKQDVRRSIYELEESIAVIEAAEGGKDTAKNLRKMADQYKTTFEKTYGEDFE